jgi:hypothetical protein
MCLCKCFWMNVVVATVLCVGGSPLAVRAQGFGAGPGTLPGAEPAASHPGPAQKLLEPIDLDVSDQPLVEVLTYLSDLTQTQIFVKWADLQDEGIAPDVSVTMSIRDARAELVLNLVLEVVSPNVTFYVRENLIVVTTKPHVPLETRVYNVSDLLTQNLPAFPGGMGPAGAGLGGEYGASGGLGYGGDAAAGLGDGAFGGLGGLDGGGISGMAGLAPGVYGPGGMAPGMPGGGGMMGPPGMGGMDMAPDAVCPACQARQAKPQNVPLIDLLVNVVDQDSWQINGGSGAMVVYQNALVVRQTWQQHREIENLLQGLRSAKQ